LSADQLRPHSTGPPRAADLRAARTGQTRWVCTLAGAERACNTRRSERSHKRNTRGSEGRSTHPKPPCRRLAPRAAGRSPAPPLPPRSAAPAAAASPCAPPYGRSKLRRRPSEPAPGVRHRAAAPRLREPYPVYARASCAHTVCTAPKHALRAGARVELPPPPPPARGAAAPSSLVVPVISPVIAGRSRRPSHFPHSPQFRSEKLHPIPPGPQIYS
jgi:hypothetical protein